MVVVRKIYPESALAVAAAAAAGSSTLQKNLKKSTSSSSFFQIKPYKHQVGGHVGIFSIDNYHICKPYNSHEALFYRLMPQELRSITAECCYEIEISMENQFNYSTSSDIHIIQEFPQSSHKHSDDGKNFIQKHNFCNNNNGFDDDDNYRDVSSGLPNALNPWAFQCQIRTLQNGPLGSFLMLENLTSKYKNPCVVDLKLGIRQYGDDASEEKKLSQKRKSDKTTSKDLGLRICGMQYYDSLSSTYQCIDKYYGRSLDQSGLKKLLNKFFKTASGERRNAVCTSLLAKLIRMRTIIASMNGLRLYGTSLLIVFEGNPFISEHNLDARLIDFANATCEGLSESKHQGPDAGSLLGIDNLIKILTAFLTKN
jgi:inositol-hexakisphosphate kinase